ncbi:shikimate dehydrogenase [Betaproteobacteria bacterium SCN2]|jgi:shikimate dehydrogenase|nr:shikimate dehydrogenase [Betaproteobacteria bacterium SCN2]
MTSHYAVFGNPVAHSRSPLIHAEFARQTGQDLDYRAILAPLDGFAAAIARFREAGGAGANVTVPFKEEAFRLATRLTPRAEQAGAVNTLKFDNDGVLGDNTDGAGLVRDLTLNLKQPLAGKSLLLMGAGGAARGVIGPLLAEQPGRLVLANRTVEKALQLAELFGGRISGAPYAALAGQRFDIVINATAASLKGELPPLPEDLLHPGALAYDMMYGSETPFMAWARQHGAERVEDGLGMLVEQAAESFFLWRGIRPDTAPVIASLKSAE